MAAIFHPTRGGNRGGKDQFKWEDVKSDKDRENYLGHSLMAPVGRWQKGKDLTWYSKDKNGSEEERRKEELNAIKDLEAQAMANALGHGAPISKSGQEEISKETLKEAFKRSTSDRSSTDGNRIHGMGYKRGPTTQKGQEYGVNFKEPDNGEESDASSEYSKKKKKSNKREKSRKKKEKKKKKTKKSKRSKEKKGKIRKKDQSESSPPEETSTDEDSEDSSHFKSVKRMASKDKQLTDKERYYDRRNKSRTYEEEDARKERYSKRRRNHSSSSEEDSHRYRKTEQSKIDKHRVRDSIRSHDHSDSDTYDRKRNRKRHNNSTHEDDSCSKSKSKSKTVKRRKRHDSD